MELRGHCLCGDIAYTATAGDEPLVALCHCLNCQRQSGSVLSLVVAVPSEAVRWMGRSACYVDSADSGARVERLFCGRCGSPLASISNATPDIAWLKAGTLDQLQTLHPQLEVWRKSAVPWLKTEPSLPALDRQD